MNMKALIISLVLILILVGLGFLYQTVPDKRYAVNMIAPNGEELGVIELSETRSGVLLSLSLEGLTPNGEHAIHIHEVGQCDGANGFKSAGGHYNPFETAHGMKHPEGHHAGDMPNLKPDEEGVLTNQILNFKVTLQDKSTKKRATVFDEDGSAIIIHAGADDHVSQPSGAAGDRIACGIIR